MDFDARDYNPLFFACRGTENWIIYEFEVMKENLTGEDPRGAIR